MARRCFLQCFEQEHVDQHAARIGNAQSRNIFAQLAMFTERRLVPLSLAKMQATRRSIHAGRWEAMANWLLLNVEPVLWAVSVPR